MLISVEVVSSNGFDVHVQLLHAQSFHLDEHFVSELDGPVAHFFTVISKRYYSL
jgi:hypothetical protein